MYESAMKSSSGWGNELDIFHPTTNHPQWLSTQGHGDDLECVSSRVSRRSVGRLAARSLTRAYTRTRDGSAHTPARRTRRRSHSYARPLELHSFIKVARTDARASRRTAPRLALAPGRPFTNGAYAISLPTVRNAHARGPHAGERLCANGRDRYRCP